MERVSYTIALLIALFAAQGTVAVVPELQSSAVPAFSRYQTILNRMPFGPPPPAGGVEVNADDAKNAAQELKEQQLLARKLNMSCVNITPSGKPAVGFTDLSTKPPVNYYLLVGGEAGGWTLKSANYDEEWAELEKDGTTIFVKLGQGLMTEPPVISEKATLAGKIVAPQKITEDNNNADNKAVATDRIILNPDEQFVQHKAFELLDGIPSPVSDPGDLTESERADIILARREMFKARRAGQDITSYKQRLELKMEQAELSKAERDKERTLELKQIAEKVAIETLEEQLKNAQELIDENGQ